jgi:cell division transport system permease protein
MPFLYAGVFYGLLGGLLSVLMITGIIQTFNYSVMEISNLYSSDFSLNLLNIDLYLTIIGLAITIGWVGSYLAVTRAIGAIKIS